MNTIEKQNTAVVIRVRFTITASFQLLEKAAMSVVSRVFFDPQTGFYWMLCVFTVIYLIFFAMREISEAGRYLSRRLIN